MGLSCSREPAVVLESSIVEGSWYKICLQHNLEAARFHRVRGLLLSNGCAVAHVKYDLPNGQTRKAFVKVHVDPDQFRFDTARARSEVELLNALRHDEVLGVHVPRLQRTSWLDAHLKDERALAKKMGPGPSKLEAPILLLEFESSAGNTLSDLIAEGGMLPERQAADLCAQLLKVIARMHERDLRLGLTDPGSIVLTTPPGRPPLSRAPSQAALGVSTAPNSSATATQPDLVSQALTSPRSNRPASPSPKSTSTVGVMDAWLLPGYPHAAPEKCDEHCVQPNHSKLSPLSGTFSSGPHSVGSLAAQVSAGAPQPVQLRPIVSDVQTSVSVNEVFEGLDSEMSESGVACAATALKVQMQSVTKILKNNSHDSSPGSTDGEERWKVEHYEPASAVLPPPRVDGSTSRDMLEVWSSVEHAEQSEIQKIDDLPELPGPRSLSADEAVAVFASAAAAIGKPGPGNDTLSPHHALFDTDAQPGNGASNVSRILETRWSFEEGGSDVLEKPLGHAEAPMDGKRYGGPISVRVRPVNSGGVSSLAPGRHPSGCNSHAAKAKRDLFAATLCGPDAPDCHMCRRSGDVCADCHLKQALKGKGLKGIGGADMVSQAAARQRHASRSSKSKGGSKGGVAWDNPSDKLHLLVHLNSVQQMDAVGKVRDMHVHADVAEAGRTIVLAVTGVDMSLNEMRRNLQKKRPLSKAASWLMLSPEARDLVERLVTEDMEPKQALEHMWLQRHMSMKKRQTNSAKRANLTPSKSPFSNGQAMRGVQPSTPSTPATTSHVASRSIPARKLHQAASFAALDDPFAAPSAHFSASSNVLRMSGSGMNLVPTSSLNRQLSEGTASTPRAQRITETTVDERGKRNCVTTFVTRRTSDGENLQRTPSLQRVPTPSQRASDHSHGLQPMASSCALTTESSRSPPTSTFLPQEVTRALLASHVERSDMLPPMLTQPAMV